MKKIALVIAMAIASLASAQAQTQSPASAANPMRILVGAGLTFGGDEISSAEYESGGDVTIRAGGSVALKGGIDYQVTPEFSFQTSIAYHVDNASADNGSMRFTRYPLELLAYYHVSPDWRIGGGARYVISPRYSSSGVVDMGDHSLKNTVGGVLEAEYLYGDWGFKLRYVKEEYKMKHYSDVYKGDHVGVFANYYF